MHYLTYLLVRCVLSVFSILPLAMASWLGGKLGEYIGPFTGRHKVAKRNLALIYPNKSANWHAKTLKGMWNHLGRVFAELPALKSGQLLNRVSNVEGKEHLTQGVQAIFVSAHLGQWELLIPVAKQHGVQNITSMYRHINNHRIDALLKSYRQAAYDQLIRKKGDNAIALLRALKEGRSLGLLIDQRLTKGQRMTFLGMEGSSNTAAIKLAVKTNTPIIPSFVTRKSGVTFEAKLHAPIHPPIEGTEEEKTSRMARQVFDVLEAEIHDHPEQYLWLHDRWKAS